MTKLIGEMQSSDNTPKAENRAFFSTKLIRGVPWLLIAKAFLVVVYLLISIILVRLLGKEQYGVYAICKSICDYVVLLCSLGLNTAILRFVPELTITKRHSNLKWFLGKAASIQISTIILAITFLTLSKPLFDSWFRLDFKNYLLLTGIWTGLLVYRNFVYDTLTAFYETKILAFLSVLRCTLWVVLVYIGLRLSPDVATAIITACLALLCMVIPATHYLLRYLDRFQHKPDSKRIGYKRTLRLSFASFINSIVNSLGQQFTEIFFLGRFNPTSSVAFFEIGYSAPLIVIGLLPASLQTLFTSGFAEAYVKDNTSIPRLVTNLYKMMILTVMPISIFGFFFSPRAVELFYGSAMAPAGIIASVFCLIHVPPLISIPMSMAVIAKEKVLNTFPLQVFHTVVKIGLDYVLISNYGIVGAILAVFGAFVITLPYRIYILVRLVGGIYFPTWFFIKITFPLLVIGAPLSLLASHLNIVTFFGMWFFFVFLYLLALKILKLIHPGDVEELRALNIPRLSNLINWLLT